MTGRPKEPHNLSHLPPGSLIPSLLTFVEKDRVEVSLFQIHVFFSFLRQWGKETEDKKVV